MYDFEMWTKALKVLDEANDRRLAIPCPLGPGAIGAIKKWAETEEEFQNRLLEITTEIELRIDDYEKARAGLK